MLGAILLGFKVVKSIFKLEDLNAHYIRKDFDFWYFNVYSSRDGCGPHLTKRDDILLKKCKNKPSENSLIELI